MSPRSLWRLARSAAENGYDVTVRPRGSSYELHVRNERVEIVARWMRADKDVQGDSEGRWYADGRVSVTVNGAHRWMSIADVSEVWTEGGSR